MDDELKPCPFCGKQHEVERAQDFHWGMGWFISCNRRVVMQAYDEKERIEMLRRWNTRPGEDALRARIAELETACNGQRRAEYDADEMRRALQHVREVLSRGRTVGHDHQQAALDAENFIIGLSQSDDEELDAICSKCGQRMEHVRPGKWQCDCQARTATHD